ncbi:hypothetical protein [Nesterenkonia rhizosphaerae]|uniref:DUF222 domain-containing protein n=1 Tax=Nesterenkonia rhizosphaerae TaxID=1348272 RepID=A0ABP9G0N2_9MICC
MTIVAEHSQLFPQRRLDEIQWLCDQIEASARRRVTLKAAGVMRDLPGESLSLVHNFRREHATRIANAAALLSVSLPGSRKAIGFKLAKLYCRAQAAQIAALLIEASEADSSRPAVTAQEREDIAAAFRRSIIDRAERVYGGET